VVKSVQELSDISPIGVAHDEPTGLVCLHGLAASGHWWRRSVGHLERLGPVTLLDLPRALAPEELADWVAESMGRREAPIDLAGHSLGALVAARVAASHPELVRRLILIAPPGIAPRRSVVEYGWPLFRSLMQCQPGFLIRLSADALRAGPRNLVRGSLHIAAADVTSELASIRAPTLLVWGARDRLVPPSTARLWQDAVRHSRLLIIPGAGHVPMFETPADLAEAINTFREKRLDDCSY
jgi:pimeloyl-ACP methyl ester carboxylesterase